ncbi:nuclear transport factor 2 family protein [Sphingobacterium prati]|uniref:nuclear transport factor 2 family protein n=1 Tax=Sphingobacterium prati TaxID=2737006 RepID=UPI000F952144|nr:nuclear transport factor 2 family protein [Sphingobacterium prati]NPE45478.1 nuclear transport factor 2 family protein [Sphingobacterium prati]
MNKDLAELMETNLAYVWNERDSYIRFKSIAAIYSEQCLLHLGHQVSGYTAINKSLQKILGSIPTSFNFFQLGQTETNSNIGRLLWGLGPDINNIVATGMDIAVFENGKIKSLYVFLD